MKLRILLAMASLLAPAVLLAQGPPPPPPPGIPLEGGLAVVAGVAAIALYRNRKKR